MGGVICGLAGQTGPYVDAIGTYVHYLIQGKLGVGTPCILRTIPVIIMQLYVL